MRSFAGLHWMLTCWVATNACALGCSDSAEEPFWGTDAEFSCTAERDSWSQCRDGRVIYCHASGAFVNDPHFHSGHNCKGQDLGCLEVTESLALCTDPALECVNVAGTCSENSARNCSDGQVTVERCGTARQCEVQGGQAICVGELPDPHGAEPPGERG